MPTKLRIFAVLLLTLITLAASATTKKSSPHKASHETTHKTSHKGSHKALAPNKSAAQKTSAQTKRASARRTSHGHREAARTKLSPAKAKRMARAFVASADLKVMARQLVENRTPAAYAGVEGYARRHAETDAGALAWLAVGYSRVLDQQYPQAVSALEKAKPNVGDLYDYVQYLEAVSYGAEGNSAKVVELLRDFDGEAPESIFQKDVVDVYGTALSAQGKTQEAIAYLEAHRLPAKASVELALGRCYLHSDHPEKGMEILRHLYFTMPTSAEAAEAATQLTASGSALEGSYIDEKTRADLLAKAGHWTDAEHAYRHIESTAPATELGSVEVALAAALRHTNPTEGQALLEQVQASGEANAERLYLLGEIARNENNESVMAGNLEQLRRETPTSPWFEQALLSAANRYLLDKNYDQAIDMFREIQQRFPSSSRASYANWKAAWLTYRQGRTENAKKDFENQVMWYPDHPEVPAALYWRARIAEDEHDYALARVWYAKLGERFQNYYYGYLGRERLAALPSAAGDAESTQDAALAQIPELKPMGPEALELEAPPNQLRAEKSRLLENAGLNEFAIRELQAEQGGQGARWATLADRANLPGERADPSRNPVFKEGAAGLLLSGYRGAAACLLGDIVSASLLDGSAAAVDGELAGPIPGGFADPAGERVQSRCRLERQRLWPDAVAAAGGPWRGAGRAHQALLHRLAAGAESEHSARYSLFQGDGDAVQRPGGVRFGRLQCGFQPRR